MHSPTDFAQHCLELLRNRGPSGPTGPTPSKSLEMRKKAGTTQNHKLGPVGFEWSHSSAASGPGKDESNQSIVRPVTTGTSGTTNFGEAADLSTLRPGPPEWYAVLAELNRRDPVDGFSMERWRQLLRDGGSFLPKWGQAASDLGWTALDLFGVHPAAPAARMDVLGLIMTLSGGEVVNLTDAAATMRRRSGAVLTFRRVAQAGAILLSEVRS